MLETPGDWYWPPMAAAITSTARLLLHLVIEMVHAAGGMVAYWDTDSVLIVALADGGLVACPGGSERMPDGREAIRALSLSEVEEIRRAVDRLLPPPEDARPYVHIATPDGEQANGPVSSLLELESANFDGPSGFPRTLYAATRASKKYLLYMVEEVGPHVEIEHGKGVVIEPTPEERSRPHAIRITWASEHGLPFEAPIEDSSWVTGGFEHILCTEWEMPTAVPDCWTGSAITHVPAARPDVLKRHPDARPFCILAVANIPLAGQVVAPTHRTFDQGRADWRDAEGRSVRTSLPGASLPQTIGDAQLHAWDSSDARKVASDGKPIGPRTEGVITSAPSIAGRMRITGKESRHLGLGRGVLHHPEFIDLGGDDDWLDLIEAARRLSKDKTTRTALREAAGVQDREFTYWLSGDRRPSKAAREQVRTVVAAIARSELRRTAPFTPVPETNHEVICAFLDSPEPSLRCQGCGRALEGRQRLWCSDGCRKRATRGTQMPLEF